MKNIYRTLGVAVMASFFISVAKAQVTQLVTPAPTTGADFQFKFDPSPDPAMRHNRLLQERTDEGVYMQVGNFKVKGSPYLFGGRNKGDMFGAGTKAYNIYLNYNTYNQELGFYSTSNPGNALVKAPGEIDSFMLHVEKEAGINNPVKFVYGSLIGSKDKSYFQEVFIGEKYSVYKKYAAELGYVSSNYTQSELRQFDLVAEYYYTGPDKKLKKIKSGTSNVVKEFKEVKDLSGHLAPDAFTSNAEEAFKRVFQYLNS